MTESTDSQNVRSPGFDNAMRHLWRQSRGSVSLMLVGVCVGLFLLVAILDISSIASRQATLASLGLSYEGVIGRLWLWQFLSAPLLHTNVTHLFFNMLALWWLGPSVERTLGKRRYVVMSVLYAMCSMLGFLAVNWGTGNVVMGYWGVIFGILVAQAVFFPNSVILIFYFFPVKMKHAALIMGAVELYLTIAPEGGGIAHAAHLFGAAAAFVYVRPSEAGNAIQC